MTMPKELFESQFFLEAKHMNNTCQENKPCKNEYTS